MFISASKDTSVVLGGGQEAMDVTTTSTKIGKFDARFFHMVILSSFCYLIFKSLKKPATSVIIENC
jgi:hypothetical protein